MATQGKLGTRDRIASNGLVGKNEDVSMARKRKNGNQNKIAPTFPMESDVRGLTDGFDTSGYNPKTVKAMESERKRVNKTPGIQKTPKYTPGEATSAPIGVSSAKKKTPSKLNKSSTSSLKKALENADW